MWSHRCCQTWVAAATSWSASGWRSAAATACWAIPTWHTTLVSPTRATSLMICCGPATQPTRQPIIRSSLEAEPTVMVRCGSGLGGRRDARPADRWKRIRSMAASQMTQAPWRFTGSAMASKCSPVSSGPGRHGGAHQQHGGCIRANGRGQFGRIGRPAAPPGYAAHVPGNAACQPDAVHEPGIDRIADDDFAAGLDRGQQDVEDAVESARDANAFRARIVVVAGHALTCSAAASRSAW